MVILIIAIFRSTSNSESNKHCYTLKKNHNWVRSGEEPDTYLVCSICKMLPGGESEEGN